MKTKHSTQKSLLKNLKRLILKTFNFFTGLLGISNNEKLRIKPSSHFVKETPNALYSRHIDKTKERGDISKMHIQTPIIKEERPKPNMKVTYNNVANDKTIKTTVEFSTKNKPGFNQKYFSTIIIPENGTKIKYPQQIKRGRKGVTENRFQPILKKYFNNTYSKIYNDRCLFVRGKSLPYEPDFTLVNEGKGIYIDIEIDEPYEITNGNPIHFIDSDLERNIHFIQRGWIVIRFSEEQIHKFPESCCKIISETLHKIDDNYNMPKELIQKADLKKELIWSYEDALAMLKVEKRNGYLETNLVPVKPIINDSIKDENLPFENDKLGKYLNEFKNRILDAKFLKQKLPINNSGEYRKPTKDSKTKGVSDRGNSIVTNSKTIVHSPILKSIEPKAKTHVTYSDKKQSPKKVSTQKIESLNAKSKAINSGGAMTSSSGNITEQKGIKNKPHRFHLDKDLKTVFKSVFGEKKNKYDVLVSQKAKIEKNYDFLNCKITNNTLTCDGTIHPKYCDRYHITVTYNSHLFPHVLIKAENHEIIASHEIHMYDDKSLCLFYAPDENWSEKTELYQTIVPWIAEWIIFYELYRIEGKWEGPESPYHISGMNNLDRGID